MRSGWGDTFQVSGGRERKSRVKTRDFAAMRESARARARTVVQKPGRKAHGVELLFALRGRDVRRSR